MEKFRLRKYTILLFSLIVVFNLIGCGTNNEPLTSEEEIDHTETPETIEQSETVTEIRLPVEDGYSRVKTDDLEDLELTEDLQESQTDEEGTDEIATEEVSSSDRTSTSDSKTNTAKVESKPKGESNGKETTKSTTKPKEENTKENNSSKPPSTEPEKEKAPSPTVTIMITGPKEVGTLVSEKKVDFKEGDTVLDILLKTSVVVDYTGGGATAYVYGIADLFEFDYGPRSGWIARVNGNDLTKSSGTTTVKEGDKITWVYLEDFMDGN
ncbi:DUF4430 domain-containing protein [Evansella tamaricis]|uniref:DUF4430 domain-containing protein n=1 Tax=Evansella tamaricis TaxID=2069301 RepID=A0ABS6JF31_9BACI|nr:DUF4430 domain-containing protein [Evansella tamaricis]MBU9712005.1 DUF4430 domain-containing protein [Evansella tamaricis]